MDSSSTVSVGSRVEYEGSYGTIRFIGKLPSSTGEWYGVEWDDPTRGKNNGSISGVRYFHTQDGGPQSASFVRPKFCRTGVGFMRAMLERYGGAEGPDLEGQGKEDMFVGGGVGGEKQKAVVMVGADKINKLTSQLGSLRQLYMRVNYIKGLDKDFKNLACPLPSASHLDLSINLLTRWQDVVEIVGLMPNLEELNVSNNRLVLPDVLDTTVDFDVLNARTGELLASKNVEVAGSKTSSEVSSLSNAKVGAVSSRKAFKSVKVLFLNRMGYNWDEVTRIISEFPSLEILHSCFNHITSIVVSPQQHSVRFDKLTLLNLEENPLSGWADALFLDNIFPNLETLILNATGIDRVEFSGSDPREVTESFKRLLTLSLNDNKINDWASVNQFNRLQSLTSLRIAGNPLDELAGGKDSLYYIIVAKIEGLKRLNGATILSYERKGAELEYIRAHGKAWLAARDKISDENLAKGDGEACHAGGDKILCCAESNTLKSGDSLLEKFLRDHPRYEYLVRRHGEAMEAELVEQKSSALKNFLITVNIDCPRQPNARTFNKKIPSTMTIQKFKVLVEKLYAQKRAGSIQLTYTSHKLGRHSPEIPLDNDLREIGFYSIEDNDNIHAYW